MTHIKWTVDRLPAGLLWWRSGSITICNVVVCDHPNTAGWFVSKTGLTGHRQAVPLLWLWPCFCLLPMPQCIVQWTLSCQIDVFKFFQGHSRQCLCWGLSHKPLQTTWPLALHLFHALGDSEGFTAFSLPGQFAPRSESANRTLANSLPGTFAPWPIRSLALSLPGLVTRLIE